VESQYVSKARKLLDRILAESKSACTSATTGTSQAQTGSNDTTSPQVSQAVTLAVKTEREKL